MSCTNPFLDKSPSDLLAMVQQGDLSDAELDALCACVCYGEWVHSAPSNWSVINFATLRDGLWRRPKKYTSDGREAMRLLVKYRLGVIPYQNIKVIPYRVGWRAAYPKISYRPDVCGDSVNPCRAIAEAALTVELARLEGDGNG